MMYGIMHTARRMHVCQEFVRVMESNFVSFRIVLGAGMDVCGRYYWVCSTEST